FGGLKRYQDLLLIKQTEETLKTTPFKGISSHFYLNCPTNFFNFPLEKMIHLPIGFNPSDLVFYKIAEVIFYFSRWDDFSLGVFNNWIYELRQSCKEFNQESSSQNFLYRFKSTCKDKKLECRISLFGKENKSIEGKIRKFYRYLSQLDIQ